MIKPKDWYFYITIYFRRKEDKRETEDTIITNEDSSSHYVRALSPIEAINILTKKLIEINCVDYHRIKVSYTKSFPASSTEMQSIIKNKRLEEETRGAKKKPKKRGRPKKKPQRLRIKKKKKALPFDLAVYSDKKIRKIRK